MLCSLSRTGQHNKRCSFYDLLYSNVNKVSAAETLLILGDFNGHVGRVANGYEGVHGGHDYGLRNTEGEHILEFAVVHDLVFANTHFHKKESSDHLSLRW